MRYLSEKSAIFGSEKEATNFESEKSGNTLSRSTVYGLRSFLRLNIDHLSSALSIFQGFHWQRLKDIIAIWFLAMVAIMTFRYNFAFFVQERFSLSNSDLGWISSYSGVMAVCTSTLCGGISNRYVNFSRHPVPALFLLLLSLVSAALSANVLQILLSLFLLSLSTAYLQIYLLGLMLERGRPDERGAILGFTYSISSLCRTFSPSLVGVAQEFGGQVCVYLAAMFAVSALAGMVCIKDNLRWDLHYCSAIQCTSSLQILQWVKVKGQWVQLNEGH